MNPYLFIDLSTETFLLVCKYVLIIFSADTEIGADVGNFPGTLAVSLVIASLEYKFKTKDSV